MPRTTSLLATTAAAIAAVTMIAACGSNTQTSSSSGDHPTQAQVQQDQQDVVRFADCMRSHGVPDFPDPTRSPRQFKNAFETKSPAFHSAETLCQHLLPRGGRQSGSGAPSHAQLVAALAFARCVRSHGFPNFPDPTSHGELTHAMLASAGINLHQPAVVQAADACVGVTHGLLTKAGVARFVAGG
jgi:hypothetical protein